MSKRPVSVHDFLNYRIVSDPQVSPDGTQVLFVSKSVGLHNNYDVSIWICSLSDGTVRPFTTGYDDTSPRWSPDGQRIVFLRGDGSGNSQLYTMPRDGGEAAPLAFFPEGSIGEFRWSPNGQWIALSFRETVEELSTGSRIQRANLGLSEPPLIIDSLWYRYDGQGYFGTARGALYLVDANSGSSSCIYSDDTLGLFSFDFSPDSQKIAITTNTDPQALLKPWKDELVLFDIASREIKALDGVPVCKKFRVRWSPDGSMIAFGGFLGEERAYCPENVHLFVHELKGANTRCVTVEHDLCFQGRLLADGTEGFSLDPNYCWDITNTSLLVSVSLNGQRHVASVDVQTGAISFQTHGPHHFELGNISANGNVVAMTRGSATALPEVFVGLRNSHKMEFHQLSHMNDFEELEVVAPEEHWIESTDGTKVQAWIFRPLTEEHSPAILDIHGGPLSLYGEGYRHDVQTLVAQGYTVIYCNPRGSKGYGQAFSLPVKMTWGGKDWEDIQAVLKYVQSDSKIDPERMGVIGASYGGYMANWATSHTTLFKAAVCDRGLCDLVSFFGTSDTAWLPELRFGASPWDKSEILWSQSPLKYVGEVKTPTLLLHGEGDLRVSITQVEEWFTSLRVRGVPARLVRYPKKATHSYPQMGPPDIRLHRLEQILIWFDTYLCSRDRNFNTDIRTF